MNNRVLYNFVKYQPKKKNKSSTKAVVANLNVDYLTKKLAKLMPLIISKIVEREIAKKFII